MVILGVDGDPVLLELASEYFESLGHSFLACRSHLEAQSMLRQTTFHAALVDYHLDRGAGRELISTLLRNYPKTRLVVTTGDHDPETAVAAKALGVRNLLFKPFRFKQIMDVITQQDPGSTGPRLTVYGQMQNDDELGELKALLLNDPADHQARWLLAFGFYRAGKYGDASHLLKTILKEDLENKLALYYLGTCRYRLGIYRQAVENWGRVVELDDGGPLGKKAKEHVARALRLMEAE